MPNGISDYFSFEWQTPPPTPNSLDTHVGAKSQHIQARRTVRITGKCIYFYKKMVKEKYSIFSQGIWLFWHLMIPLSFLNIPEFDCLNTETTCFRNTVNCSALFMFGFLADTSSWFQSGPRFLEATVKQKEELIWQKNESIHDLG